MERGCGSCDGTLAAATSSGLALWWSSSARSRHAASQLGWPLVLVLAQTSRLTPLLVLLGVLAAAAALEFIAGRAGRVAWLGVLSGGLITNVLLARLAPFHPAFMTVSAIEAGLVLLLLASSPIVRSCRWPASLGLERRGVYVAGALLAFAPAGLVYIAHAGAGRPPPERMAYRDVALRAQELSAKGDVILTPPDLTMFSAILTERPSSSLGSISLPTATARVIVKCCG